MFRELRIRAAIIGSTLGQAGLSYKTVIFIHTYTFVHMTHEGELCGPSCEY